MKRQPWEWDAFFYSLAERVASMSKDPDRKVGAVIVSADRRQLSMGYNGFPPEIPDTDENLADRDFKLHNMRHAEHNCLIQAPFPTTGTTLYVTRFPCLRCAILLTNAGVSRVVSPEPDLSHPRWGDSWGEAVRLLEARRVAIVRVEDES